MVSPSCPPAAEIILKVDCEGDMRRALLSGNLTYATIDHAVQEIFPRRSAREAKYLDEEGDSCTLAEHTFTDFLCTAKKTATGQVLKLLLSQASVPLTVGDADATKVPSATEGFTTPWQHIQQGDGAGFYTVTDLTDIPDGQQESPAVESACLKADCLDIEEEVAAEIACQEMAEEEVSESECEVANEGPGLPVPVSESQLPKSSTAGERCNWVQQDHSAAEMVDIIIVAFDETGDGHLNLAESNALQKAAGGGQISMEVFQRMCADWGEDSQVGLGRDALMCRMHSEALRNNFEAAKRKLQGKPTEVVLCECDECRGTTPSHTHRFLQRSGTEVASRILGHAQQLRCSLGSTLRGPLRTLL